MALRRALLWLGVALGAGLSVQDERRGRHSLTLLASQVATAATPFKSADPNACKSIVAATTDEWCVSTCARACPPQQCACEGDQEPLVPDAAAAASGAADARAAVERAAKASADAASEAAEAQKADIEKATAAKFAPAPAVPDALAPEEATSPTATQPFKPSDPSTCKSIVAATTDAWCVSTCLKACPPQQCACEGDQEPLSTTMQPASAAPAVGSKEWLCDKHGQCDQPTQPAATVPAGVVDSAGQVAVAGEDAAAAAAAAATAAAEEALKNIIPASESSSAQRAFKPTDAGTCYSIVDSTTDDWCINTCVDACPPQICACDSDSGPVQAVSATPLPKVDTPSLPTWGEASGKEAFTPLDHNSCLSIAPGTTDVWCVSTCERSCPPQMCVCDAAASNASAIMEANMANVAPGAKPAPHYANGSPKAPKWVGDERNFGGGNMNCISLEPSTADQWCQVNCVTATAHQEVSCPEDRCRCDEDAQKQREEQHQETVANWNEAEARVRSAEIDTAYPDGLPPAPDDVMPAVKPGAPKDLMSCKAVTPPATDLWCRRVCEDGVCPRQKCECDGMKPEDYSDSEDNSHFTEDPSNLKDKDDPKHNGPA